MIPRRNHFYTFGDSMVELVGEKKYKNVGAI